MDREDYVMIRQEDIILISIFLVQQFQSNLTAHRSCFSQKVSVHIVLGTTAHHKMIHIFLITRMRKGEGGFFGVKEEKGGMEGGLPFLPYSPATKPRLIR